MSTCISIKNRIISTIKRVNIKIDEKDFFKVL